MSRQYSSPAPEQSGECRVGLHLSTMALPKGPSHVLLVAGTHTMLANAGGTTSRLKGRFDSGRSRLAQADRIVVYLDRTQAYCPINPGRQHQEQRRRMLAGLQVRASAAKAGGRRFNSAPGEPGSSEENVSPNLVAGTEMQPWRMPRGTTLLIRMGRFDSGRSTQIRCRPLARRG